MNTTTIEDLRAAWKNRETREEAAQELRQRLQPATLKVYTRYGAESVEVNFEDYGHSISTDPEFAVLAGRTATKTRVGALTFSRFYGPRTRFDRVNDEIWAEDENGNLYGFNGVSTTGNKGQYGCRVVGHVSNHEITAQV